MATYPKLDADLQGHLLNYRVDGYSPSRGSSIWGIAPLLAALCDPVGFYYVRDDLDRYVAADWTVTEVGNGTQALTDAAGGVLLLTNTAVDDEGQQLQKLGESYKLVASKPLWFETRLKISDATQMDFLVGLAITDTTLIAANSDGVNFRKADGSTSVSFVTEKNSTETTTTGVHTAVADTYVRLGFYWDGSTEVVPYVNGVAGTAHTANICDDEELTVSFAIQNGEGAAKTMSIDYYAVLQVR